MYFEAIPFFIGNGRLCGDLSCRPSGFPRLVSIQEVKNIPMVDFQGDYYGSSLMLLRQLFYACNGSSLMLATAALLCLLRQISYAYYGSSLMLVTAALLCLLRQLSYACYGNSLMLVTAVPWLRNQTPLKNTK
jgi:hypothetical protein